MAITVPGIRQDNEEAVPSPAPTPAPIAEPEATQAPISNPVVQPVSVQQDSFTSTNTVEESRPSTIKPAMDAFAQAGQETVHVNLEGEQASQRDITALSMSAQKNYNQPMDKAARILKLEMDTGLPSAFIAQNLDDVEKQSLVGNFSIENFRKNSPKFASWVASNETHLPLVKDDIRLYQDIEAQSSLAQGWTSPNLQSELSGIIGREMNDTSTPADARRKAEINQIMQVQGELNEGETNSQMLMRTGAYMVSQLLDSSGAAATGAAVGAILAPFTAGLSIPAGARVGAITASALTSYEMETNFAYDDLVNTKDVNGNPMNKDTAKLIARGIGVVNAAIETAGDVIILKMIPGGDKLLGGLTKGTRKNITELATKALARKSTAAAVIESVTKMFAGSASEGVTEFVQSLVGGAGARVAENVSGQEFAVHPSWHEDLSQGALEGKEAFWGTFVTLGLAHGGANFYNHRKAIQNGENNAMFFDALSKGVQSKSFQTLPDKAQEAVRAAIARGAGEKTYFQHEQWDEYWQGKGVDPREVASQVAQDGGKSYDAAVESGGHIEIPTERVGRKLLANDEHTELLMDATIDPKIETPREALVAMEALKAEQQAAKEQQNTEREQSKNAVETDITNQLKEANAPGDAKVNAKLYAKIADTLSATGFKSGPKTAQQLVEKYGLKIGRILGLQRNNGDRIFNQSEMPGGFNAPDIVNVHSADNIDEKIVSSKKLAGDKFKKKYQGNSFVNDQTGWSINVAADAVSKFMSGGSKREHIIAGLNLDKLIKNAIYFGSEENTKKDRNTPTFARFYAPLKIDGKDYIVRLKVAENKDGKKFYHEVIVEAERPTGNLGGESSQLSDDGRSAFSWSSQHSLSEFLKDLNATQDIHRWFQNKGDNPQGSLDANNPNQMNISLYAKANFSTFAHEQAHFWFEVIADMAEDPDASDRIKEIFSDTLKYLGIENRSQIERKHHEMLAQSFEKYLQEGKAPTQELQGIFNTFKVWMDFIYHKLNELKVELSPEIRSVFDRMLATDDEINQAKKEQGMGIEFDPAEAGMNQEVADKYMKLKAEAKQVATNILTSKIMRQIFKERTALWKEEEATVRDEKTKIVNDQEDQVLLKMLKTGKMEGRGDLTIKIDKKTLINAYGKDFVDQLPKGIFGKDGFTHDELAGIFGFESGWDMIEMIANTENPKTLIDKMTKDEMLERHGDEDIYVNGKLHDVALEAVHNDKMAELMRMEYDYIMQKRSDSKLMIKSILRRVPTVKQVREKAIEIIGRSSISSIKPYQYLRNEKKYASESLKFMLQGNWDSALESKKKQILNHELYRAANDAVENIEKSEGKFAKVFQSDERLAKTRDMNIIGAARAILAGFEFGNNKLTAKQHMDKIRVVDPEGYELQMSRVTAALENAENYENLTYDKFSSLAELIDSLWVESKNQKSVTIDQNKMSLESVIEDMGHGLDALVDKMPALKQDKYDLGDDEVKKSIREAESSAATKKRIEFIIDILDSVAGGVFRKYLYEPVRKATEMYRSKKIEMDKRFLSILEGHKNLHNGEIIATELIGKDGKVKVFKNKLAVLGAAMHMGNESNKKKLLLGMGWGSLNEDKTLNSADWDAFVDRVLTKEDMDTLQGIWDLFASIKEETQKSHYEMFGFNFGEIVTGPIVTKHGTYAGGYVPAIADKTRSLDPKIRSENGLIEDDFSSEVPPKNNAFTKARDENYATPLVMDLSIIPHSIDKALRFTYVNPRVKDTMKILHNKEFRARLEAYDHTLVSNVFVPYLVRAASQKTTISSNDPKVDKAFTQLKTLASAKLMFLHMANIVQQFAQYVPAGLMVQPHRIAAAFVTVNKDYRSARDGVYAMSPFMKNLGDDVHKKALLKTKNILTDANIVEKGGNWFESNVYIGQTMLQDYMNLQIWIAARDQAKSEGKGDKEAVSFADSVIRKTQGSYAAEDISANEVRSPAHKAIHMFYGYFNNMQNLYASEWRMAGNLDKAEEVKRKAYISANFLLQALAAKLLYEAVKGAPPEKDHDEDDTISGPARWILESLTDTIFPMYGIAGQMAGIVYSQATGQAKFGGSRISSPALSMSEDVRQFIEHLNSKHPSDKTMTKDLFTMAGYIPAIGLIPLPAGLNRAAPAIAKAMIATSKLGGYTAPLGAIKKPVSYMVGVNEGKDNADNPLNIARGLVTGRSGK